MSAVLARQTSAPSLLPPMVEAPSKVLLAFPHGERAYSEHPLGRVRSACDEALRSRCKELAELCPQSESSWLSTERLIRSTVLQVLYSIRSDYQLIEQLHYNLLYRWFVGLGMRELVVDAACYARNRQRLIASAGGRSLIAAVLTDERVRLLMRDLHFCLDETLADAWTGRSRGLDEGVSRHPVTSVQTPKGVRLDKARHHVLSKLGDPDLSAESMAAALCMSRRALYLLFKEHGLTPTRMMQNLRLEGCEKVLRDPRQQQRKIGAVALDHGFCDYPSFNRLFKARYGLAPSEYRARAVRGGMAAGVS